MIKYELYYNATYKNSCNLIKKVIKGNDLYINRIHNIILIDNKKVATFKELNSIRFLIGGYYQSINIASPKTKIKATNIEYESEVK